MRQIQLLGAVVIGLGLAAVAGYQVTPAPALSDALRAHLEDERFGIVTSVRGLPLGVREAMQTLFGGGSLDIADPDVDYQGSKTSSTATLASRRLVVAGCSSDHCLVYYERAGAPHTWRVALFHWTPGETRFEGGGAAASGLQKVDDVRGAILSAGLENPGKSW